MTFYLYTKFIVLKKCEQTRFVKALAFCKYIVTVEENNVVKDPFYFI